MGPRRLGYRLSLAALVSLVTLYLAVCAYFWFGQERFVFRPQKLSEDYRFQFSWPYSEVRVPLGNGVTLDAVLVRASESKGVVFFVHGNAGNLQNNCKVAGAYLDQGYDFFCFDYRGFGKSGGTITSEAQLHDDVSRAYAWVLQRYPEEKIVVVGSSLGTGPAAKIACSGRVRHLVLLAPYWSMLDVARERYPVTRALPQSLVRYPLPTHLYLKSCRVPVTIIHGTADDMFPVQDAESLSRLLPPERCRLVEIPGARHNVSETTTYRAVVRQVLSAAR